MERKQRKVKFVGVSSHYAWSVKPVYGEVYTESEIKRMYGSWWGTNEMAFDFLLELDEDGYYRDFEEVFDAPDKLDNEKDPTHFSITVWVGDENVESIEYPIDMYDKLVEDAEELLEDKSHMLLEQEEGHVIIPYKRLKKSQIYFNKLWKEKK
jgi:hypothetical protein